jgi:hypothetical protein
MSLRPLAAVAWCIVFAAPAGCCRKSEPSPTAKPTPSSVLPNIPGIPGLPDIPDISNIAINVAEGHVESTGSTGAWKLDGGACYAGDNDGYFGIRVQSRTDEHTFIKLVKDPIHGWNLLASIPSTCQGTKCTLQHFRPEECKPLDVNLKAYTFQKKGTHQFDGDVTFDCTHDKAHVKGKLTVTRCVNLSDDFGGGPPVVGRRAGVVRSCARRRDP